MNDKTRICIYGLGTYNLLTNSEQDYIGGAELQMSLLGKELIYHNFDVNYIVFDHGQPDYVHISGINMYKTLPNDYKIQGIYSLLNAIYLSLTALNKCNCDIYYYRGIGRDLGIIGIFCLLKRRKLVLGMASNKDVLKDHQKDIPLIMKVSFRIGLKLSRHVICQNNEQLEVLNSQFKINATKVNNMHPIPEKPIKKKEVKVIWVGTIRREWKQPELFLKLAKEIPEAEFQMIGGFSNIEFYNKIKESALQIPNLEFVGFVPYPQVNKYFENASLLVNTSSVEGFPNTFIQAWMRGVPTVSLNVDPDEIITNHKLGYCSKTFSQLVEDTKCLLYDEKLRMELGNNARQFAESNFDTRKIIKQYIEIFNSLLE